jgi:hypothetical protein
MFKVLPTKVDTPLVPVVVSVIAPCFALKVIQSADDKAPLLVAEAVGILIVIFPELVTGEPLAFMSVPEVPKVMPTEVTPRSKFPCMKV